MQLVGVTRGKLVVENGHATKSMPWENYVSRGNMQLGRGQIECQVWVCNRVHVRGKLYVKREHATRLRGKLHVKGGHANVPAELRAGHATD